MLAGCLAGFIVCLAAAIGFVIFYLNSSRQQVVDLQPAVQKAVESSNEQSNFQQNGGVPLKMDRKGKLSPTTFASVVLKETPDFSLEGQSFEVAPFQNGEKVYLNRNYVWQNLPAQFAGWKFTRISVGAATSITATANRATTIFAAVIDVHNKLNLAAWSQVPGISFRYSQPNQVALKLYQRTFAAGQEFQIHEQNSQSMLFLIPAGPAPVQVEAVAIDNPPASTQPTDFAINGLGYEIAALKDGEKAFLNRAYVWEKVPPKYSGWQFVRVNAGAGSQMTLTANHAATLFAAVNDNRHHLDLSQWTLVPDDQFTYSDRAHTAIAIYQRTVTGGEQLEIKEAAGALMEVMVPAGTTLTQSTADPIAIAPATQPASVVLSLAFGQRPPAPTNLGLMAWEVYRQSLLIAARDELGLQTRDDSLREWEGNTPAGTLAFTVTPTNISLAPSAGGKAIWNQKFEAIRWGSEPFRLAEVTEKWSRNELPALLRRAGYIGTVPDRRIDAPAPVGVEELLNQFDEFSQFAALRLTHDAIRKDGQSPACIGALVRAYANLSLLTRYHWSGESSVYSARALLYAQRMVAVGGNPAMAMWHRAYAKALIGFPASALKDLQDNPKSIGVPPPAWVALLEPFCKYQTKKLTEIAAADPAQAPLASMLAFLTVQNGGGLAEFTATGRAAIAANPHCTFLIDAICDQAPLGEASQMSNLGPAVFREMLADALLKLPQLPKPTADLITQSRRPDGNPTGRQAVCASLIQQGAPDLDKGEPTWSAIGRSIQETTFAQARRQIWFYNDELDVDSSDLVKQVEPVIADHPYHGVIDAYGVEHNDIPAMAKLIDALPLERISLSGRAALSMQLEAQNHGVGVNRGHVYESIFRNSDLTSVDLERNLALWVLGNGGTPQPELETWLQRVAPDSPVNIELQIRDHYSATHLESWEAAAAEHSQVAMALSKKYEEHEQWSDAERLLKQCVATAPDYPVYEELASVYYKQKKEDEGLATLKQAMELPDTGLQHAQVQAIIAEYFMNEGKFDKALPYADAAAQTYAGWAMKTDAAAHAGTGDWDGADALCQKIVQRYDDESPSFWYFWCVRTGRGNRAAAEQALRQFMNRPGALDDDRRLLYEMELDLLDNRLPEAETALRQRMKSNPKTVSELFIALVADQQKEFAARDESLSHAATTPKGEPALMQLAAAFSAAAQAGPDAWPDSATLEAVLKSGDVTDHISSCLLISWWLDNRGRSDEAAAYLRRIPGYWDRDSYTYENPESTLAHDALRRHRLDPLEIEKQAVPDFYRDVWP